MTIASCPTAIKSDVDGYMAIIFAPTYVMHVRNSTNARGLKLTLDPKVKYPKIAITSYVMAADPIALPITTFIRFWLFVISSLYKGRSYIQY